MTVDLALALLSGYSPALHEVLFILLTLIIYIPAFSEKRGGNGFPSFLCSSSFSDAIPRSWGVATLGSKYHQEYWGMNLVSS